MITALCLAVGICITPTPDMPTDPVLATAADTAEDRAFLRGVEQARNLVTFVDALNAPAPESGPRLGTSRFEAAGSRPSPPGVSAPVAGTCGGDLPDCSILECESGGDPRAQNPRSSASGLWQIIDSTWNGFGGYARVSDAPPEVQNAKAAQLWAGGAGARHWKECR